MNLNTPFDPSAEPPSAAELAEEQQRLKTVFEASERGQGKWKAALWLTAAFGALAQGLMGLGGWTLPISTILPVLAMVAFAWFRASSHAEMLATLPMGVPGGMPVMLLSVLGFGVACASDGYLAAVAVVNLFTASAIVGSACFVLLHQSGMEDAETALSWFAEMPRDSAEAVLEDCLQFPELAAYQTKVANSGRSLVRGEADALHDWARSAVSRERQASLNAVGQAALEALRRPVVPEDRRILEMRTQAS